jgi:hypothetical protein
MRTEMGLKTMVYSPFNHLRWLIAKGRFIDFNVPTSWKSLIRTKFTVDTNKNGLKPAGPSLKVVTLRLSLGRLFFKGFFCSFPT